MAFVVKLTKSVRNHWKKSIFFSGCFVYGAKYAKDRYEEEQMRRKYCERARQYGQAPVQMGEKMKKVTIFLNPAARNGKVRKLFEKNAAPILHLAGFEVNIVKTEGQGQAKDFMSVIDSEDADVIVIAGGDGTVSEILTGLLRKKDQSFVDRTPVGVLPLGQTNSLAKLLFKNNFNDVRWIADAAMAIVENVTKKIDVMSVTGNEDKTVYAISHMQWGAYRDADAKKSKYWYFAGLKDRWSYIMSAVRQNWPPALKAELTYVLPCEGCSKCYQVPVVQESAWKWWHMFLPPAQTKISTPIKDYTNVLNEECGQVHSQSICSTEVSVLSSNYPHDQKTKSLILGLGQGHISRMDFIREGWRRIHGSHPEIKSNTDKVIEVQEFQLTPQIKEGEEKWFTLDSEPYEAMPIHVKLLKDKLTVFCDKEDITS